MNNISSEAEALVNDFKKSGQFDQLRLDIYKSFEESNESAELKSSVEDIVLKEFNEHPEILQMDTYKALAVLEQAIVRNKTDVYKDSKGFMLEKTRRGDFQAKLRQAIGKSSAEHKEENSSHIKTESI